MTDTRADFQRLLEDMDRVIQSKRQELTELDERLGAARLELSEREAKELAGDSGGGAAQEGGAGDETRRGATSNPLSTHNQRAQLDEHIRRQTQLYEQQLEKFGYELAELESINQELAKENELLRRELLVSQSSCDQLASSSRQLEASLQESQAHNLELKLRLSKAEGELEVQERLLKKSHQEDEVLMDALNDKLDQLRQAIERRDEEIGRLRAQHQFVLRAFGIEDKRNTISGSLESQNSTIDYYSQSLRPAVESIQAAQMGDSDHHQQLIDSESRQRVLEIVSAFREKDAQIELLKGQLLSATKDLEQNANLLESYNSLRLNNQPKSSSEIHSEQVNDFANSNQELAATTTLARYRMLESELEAKDKQLHALECRRHHYETILPNMISDLVRELLTALRSKDKPPSDNGDSEPIARDHHERINGLIDSLQGLLNGIDLACGLMDQVDRLSLTVEAREAQIRQLVDELNQLDAKFGLVQQQCDLLQQQSPARFTDQPAQRAATESTRDQPMGEGAPQRVGKRAVRFAEDQLGSQATQGEGPHQRAAIGEQSIKRTTTADQTLRDASGQVNGSGQQGAGGGARESKEQQQSHRRSISETVEGDSRVDCSGEDKPVPTSDCGPSDPSKSGGTGGRDTIGRALSIQSRLRQLEAENELLELAMKEILMALRWSDGQCSTLLIDCPSLERLCQLIEARFLATSGSSTNAERPPDGANSNRQLDGPSAGRSPNEPIESANLFQLVVLKSELDLLRGQNEQLRVDVKSQRREYLELLRSQTAATRPPNDRSANLESGDMHDPATAAVQCSEASSQTEPSNAQQQQLEEDDDEHMQTDESDTRADKMMTKGGGKRMADERCENCSKLAKLTGHLSQSIMRIETRVSVSDETYLSRMISLHQLVRILERDLSARESLLNGSRRECHLLVQQKLMLEARLQLVEHQLTTHLVSCRAQRPGSAAGGAGGSDGGGRLQVFTAARNGNGDSIQSHMTIHQGSAQPSGQQPAGPRPQPRLMRDARLTISLLKSIINCLQARLNFKDERLQQLEALVSSSGPTGVESATPSMVSCGAG